MKKTYLPMKNIILAIIFILFSGVSLQAQVTIYTENFENGGNMPTGWTQEYVLDTLNWVFTSGGYNGNPSTAHGGSFNGLLFYAGSSKKTKLVSPQLNLSYYSNISLKFWHCQKEYSGDQDILRVYYKTSASGSWTLLQTYSNNISTWTQQTISLPNPSSTYYIAFEGEAKYGYGICVDDVLISGNVTSGTDISCIGINAPVIWNVGSNTLKINYKNMRSDTIKNADFGYKIDNGTPVNDTNKSTGNLLANQTGVYTFSSAVSVTKGNHTIKVWARKPNRKNPDDDPSNDTFSTSFGTGIKDTFIIDKKGGGDYTSFGAAVADLNNGVAGKVVFIVKPGTYTERVIIGDIPGVSSTNTVLFYSQYPDSVILTYASTSQSTRATLVLKGADYVTFKNINIYNTGNTYGVCVLFRNQSNYNKFENCKFYLSSSTTSQYSQIILGSSDESSLGTSGDNGNNNTFQSCLFSGGYYGVSWYGTNTAQPAINNAFKGCTFLYQYAYGIYLYYQQGFELSYSSLKSFRYASSYAVISYYSCGGKFDANVIQPGIYGIYLYLENYYNQTKTTQITNNMISNFSNTQNQVGIYAYYYCYNLNIYHNSIWVDGSANLYTYACINMFYYANNSVIKNNLLAATNANYLLTLTYANTVTIDYNDYYVGSSSSSKFSLNYSTMNFSSFKASSSYINYPHDQNSFDNIDPKFVSKTNLHLDTLNTPSLMAPGVGLSRDIDNEVRSTTLGVNLGADEIRHPSRDLDIVSIDSPTVLKMGYNTVSVTLRNSGTDSIPVQKIYLSYNINGGTWVSDSFTLSQKLAPFATIKFSFNTKWNVTSSSNHVLCVRIYPKIINDPDNEDKICETKCVGKSGVYYIDASGKGDFTTFNAALNSIQTCGLAGPIKFIVKAGTYVERVVVNPIIGASSANTVTFEGVHRDSVVLIYSGGSSDRATLVLNGADFIIFRNMKIINNGNTYGTSVVFKSEADSNLIENCVLQVSSTVSTAIICVMFSGSETSYSSYGNNGNYNVLKDNLILNGYFGVVLNGLSKDVVIKGNSFINNQFSGQYYVGVYAYYIGNHLFKGNKFSNFSYGFAYGMYIYYSTGNRIEDNIIQPGYAGILLYRENDVFRNNKTYIINNMISNFANSAYHMGIYGYYYSQNLRIYHNSIWNSSSTTSTSYACIYLYLCDSAIIKNNLFKATNNACLVSYTSGYGIESNYNNYSYPTGTSNTIFYNNASYTTFSAFKSSSGCLKTPHDQNSYDNKDPDFISNTDLHLKPTSAGLGGATGLGVVYDIDGDYRCQTYPSLGADEGGAKALFTVNDSIQCFDGHKFIFTNQSQGGSATLSYKWDFGDGSTSTATNPQKTYVSTGTYTVKLIVYPSVGCNDTFQMIVKINPSANASFTVNNVAQCLNSNYFTFTNTSTISSGSMTYSWDFGDGYFAGVTNASHVYDNSGSFNVRLIVTSNLGCKDTSEKTVTVYPKPVADFTINSATQCSQGNNFVFTNQSSISSGTLSYLWNFGDGTTSTQTSPSHSYSSSNIFSVKLIATSNFGCKDSITKTTKVDPTPTAGFTVNDTSQCLNQNSFVFTNTTTVSGGSVSYLWYFGDNTTSTSTSPTHVYSAAGTYQVKLVAGTTQGCKDSVTRTVVVHPSLIAGFSVNNSNQCYTGNYFSFTNSSTTTTGTTSYYWSFGDGDSAFTTHASHHYLDIGTFNVELLASSTNGCSDSITKQVTVKNMPLIEKDTILNNLLSNGILAYYPLNGNAQDRSGNDNHATAYNTSLTTNKCNQNDSAFYFNGTSAYLQAPHAVLLTPSVEFSFSAWIYPTKSATTQYLIYKYNPSQYKGYQVRLYNNKVGVLLGGQVNPFYSDSTVKINQWNHVVVTFDGENYRFYLNNQPAGSGTAAFNYLATTPLYIGRQSGGNYYEGKMDEIRIFEKKLSNYEISALYYQSPYIKVSGNNVCSGNQATVYIYNSQPGVEYSLWDTITNSMLGSKTDGNGCKITLSTGGITSDKVVRIKALDKNTNCYTYFDTLININVAPNPVAGFSVNDETQCQTGNNFIFTNTSSISSGTMTYLWKFGDNTTSTQASPSHSYSNYGTYSAKLIATSNYGCKDSTSKTLEVYAMPVAGFSLSSTSQCENGNSFSFTNTSTIASGTITYLWRFGDGTTSTTTNPVKSYAGPGTYTVWLVVSSGNNCKDSVSKTLTIYPSPVAGFNVDKTSACQAGNSFSFTNTSTISSGTISYLWRFGDGTTSTATHPVKTYSSPGTFTIWLIVTSNNGCKDSVSKNITVYPSPVAGFNVDKTSSCQAGNSFSFTNTSAISSGTMNYLWRFGDGTTSTATNPVKSYSAPGTYTVWLVVSSDNNCKDSVSKTLTIYPSPVAGFNVSPSQMCQNNNIFTFTNTSTISSGTMSYLWKFGDNTTSTVQHPTHSYSSSGIFDVVLIVTSGNGCKDSVTKTITVHPKPVASFIVPDSSQCFDGNGFAFVNKSTIASGTMTYLWDFGDGSSSTAINPVHSYSHADTFMVKLVVTSDKGCKDSTIRQALIHVNPMPHASFIVNDSDQCLTGNLFNFTDKTTISGGNFTRTWRFGDNTTATIANPSHSFSQADTFYTELVVVSDKGCRDSVARLMIVFPHPDVAFSINDTAQCLSGNSFVFTNNTTLPYGTFNSYWTFGNGASSVSTHPTYSYSGSGTYDIKLVATSSFGCKDSASRSVVVYPLPSASFSVNDSTQCLDGNSFVFTDQSTSSSMADYNWYFGDGSQSTAKNPSHHYTTSGTYQVKLVLSIENTCNDSFVRNVYVYPEPVASFTVNNDTQCFNTNNFVFGNTSSISSGTLSYAWNFGDAGTSNATSPSHTYTGHGNYTVSLIAVSDKGCDDTTQTVVTIHPSPNPAFSINDDDQCLNGNSFSFTNNSAIASGTLSYSWSFGDGQTSTSASPSHSYTSPGTYQVRLMAVSNQNCSDSLVKTVTVRPDPDALFTVNDTDQCRQGNEFIFTNQSSISGGSFSNYWTFGDNTSSTATNPSHSYTSAGTYSVKLVVTSGYGCKDSMLKSVIVYPVPVVDFSINDTTQCLSGNQFNFTNNSSVSSGSLSYLWNFGDNTTSSQQNPSHSYSSHGTYQVKLVVITDKGCKDSLTKTVVVYPVPSVAFSVNDSDQCFNGNSFSFTNQSSISSGTLSYFWQFGDNTSSSQTSPVHTYSAAGSFSVKLIAQSGDGCQDSASKIITVYPAPLAGFSVNNSSQCHTGNSFSFTNTSSISSGTMNYLWSFGDDSTSTSQNPVHSYLNPGTYSVKLVVTSGYGCKDSTTASISVNPMPKVDFSVNDSTQCLDGNSFSFTNASSVSSGNISSLWSFGDNTTSVQTHPSHTFTTSGSFSVKLIVTTDKGCKDSASAQMTVYPEPVASFTINNDTQCFKGNTFVLTNTSSISSGSLNYQWSFGDGNGTNTTNASISYTTYGNFNIKLLVTSDQGCVDSVIKPVRVEPSPVVAFAVNDTDQCKNGNNFSFTNNSTLAAGTISYLWNFGDGNTSSAQHPSHAYSNAGTYSVKLIATSDKSCADSVSKTITVYPSANVGFSVNDTDQCSRQNSFIFTNSTTVSSGTLTYLWTFGDGNSSSSQHDTHSYVMPGTYQAKLTAVTDKGCQDSAMKQIYVYPTPQPAFAVNDTDQCLTGNSFSMTNNSTIASGTMSYLWNFGDNTQSSQQHPVHTYAGSGSYQIKLLVTSDKNCVDSSARQVYVYPSPQISVSVNDSTQCLKQNKFVFSNSTSISSGSLTYLWKFGDGDTSTSSSPQHIYASAGNYIVRMYVNSDKGCSDSVLMNVYVLPDPTAGFTVNDTDQCLKGNSFVFTDKSTVSSGTLSYYWTFGNGSYSTAQNPQNSYTSDDTFLVKLVVTASSGCSDSLTLPVYVYPSPVADFTINDSIQCFGTNNLKPVNNSSVSSGTLTYLWDFGDGTTSSLKDPVHSYTQSGNYTLKLLTISDKGCSDSMTKNVVVKPGPKAGFTVNDTDLCLKNNLFSFTNTSSSGGTNPKYLWQFGDGDTSTLTNPNHIYKNYGTFNVKLVVVPDSGCTDTFSRTIYVYPQPKAAFTVNDSDQCLTGNRFIFTNSSSIPSGTISYNWNFGDGGSSLLQNPQYIYSKSGNYSVRLTVVSDKGCRDSVLRVMIVDPSPVVSFSVNDTTQCKSGNYFTFTDLTAGSGNTRKWYFGDGGTSVSGPAVNHSYANDGTYNVKLVVTSSKGCKDSLTGKVYVYPQPVAGFNITNSNPCQNDNNVLFTNTSTIKSGTLTYLWNFGDGGNSGLKDPQHHYLTSKTFDVKMVVTSNMGCKDSLVKQVVINPSPVAAFNINKNPQCFKNNHFVFLNQSTVSSGTMSYLWDFGDIHKSTDTNSSHIYLTYGNFNAKLVVTTDKGCKDSIVRQTTVYPSPSATFDVDNPSQCFFLNSFKFTNKSTIGSGTMSYYWNLGDGTTSNAADTIRHSYKTIDTFQVMLVANSDKACPDTFYKDVYLRPSPPYSLGPDRFTKPGLIYTLDAGPGYVAYQWYDGTKTRLININTQDLGKGDHLVWVIVTDASGCKNSDTIWLHVWPSGIRENGLVSYKIYPNPARDQVNIDIDGLNDDLVNISITDVNGKETDNISLNSYSGQLRHEVDVNHYAKGIYFIKINVGKNWFIEKLVIY